MRSTLPISLLIGLAVLTSACTQRCYRECSPCEEVVNEQYVHKYGVTIPQKEWSNRGKTGQVVSTLKTGVVVTKTFADGALDGETSYTFPHRTLIERIETFSQGQLIKTRDNFPSGSPKIEVKFEPTGTQTVAVWYEDGTPHSRETYDEDSLHQGEYFTANQKLESRIDQGYGEKVNRDGFGHLYSRDTYENGQLAIRTTYYPNEAPKEVIPYVRGKVNGEKKTFTPSGEPITVEEWCEDAQDGTTVFFENGEKAAEVPYVKGVKSGIEERFQDGEFVVEEITWKRGRRHGPCYSHVGERTHVSWYYDGNRVTKAQYDRMTHPPML